MKTLLALSFIALLLLSSVALALPAYALTPLDFDDGSTFSSLNSGHWQHVWNDDTSTAIVFNGSTQYLQAANNTVYDVTTQDFWMAGMFKVSSIDSVQTIVGKKANSAAAAGYWFNIRSTNGLQFGIGAGTSSVFVNTPNDLVQADTWYAWGLSADRDDDATIYLYNIDTKTLTTTTDDISSQSGSLSNNLLFSVGRLSNANAFFLDGSEDNLIPPQIGETLTEEQFLEFATTGKISGITPTSFYGFNEGAAGATVLDRLGNNNLTPFNSPTYTTDVPSSSLPENMTYFVDTNQGSFKAVRYDRIYNIHTDVTATLSSSANPSAASPIEKVGGAVRVYTAQQMNTTRLEVNIVNLWTGAFISSANFTLTATNTISGSPIAVASTKNAVYYVVQGTTAPNLGFYRSNRDLSSPTAINTGVETRTNHIVRMQVATNGAAIGDDVIYVVDGSAAAGPNQGPSVIKVTSATASSLGTIGAAATTTALTLTNVADKQIITLTQSGTTSTYTITKATDAISSVAFTETWNTLTKQPYNFDGTTLSYVDSAYYAHATRSIAYESDGTLEEYDTLFVASVNNVTGAITGIADTFYRITDALVVTGSGTTWTPKTFDSVSIAPVPYSERLSVAPVQNNTLFGDNVFRLVCDAPYEFPQASAILVGDDSDCVSWRVLAEFDDTIGRELTYTATTGVVHAVPYTTYGFELETTNPSIYALVSSYDGKTIDTANFDSSGQAQQRYLFGQCYRIEITDENTGMVVLAGTACANDFTTKTISLTGITIPDPLVKPSWNYVVERNSTNPSNNIISGNVSKSKTPFNATIYVADHFIGAYKTFEQTFNYTNVNIANFTISGITENQTLYFTVSEGDDNVLNFQSQGNFATIDLSFLDIFGEFFGIPLAGIFVILFAGLFTKSNAYFGVFATAAVVGVMSVMGMLDIASNLWTLILVIAALGMFGARKFL